MIVPSSWMSICVPVSSVIAWITEPPLPITSRILSGWILMVIRRGANSLISGARRGQRLGHLAEDVQAAVLGLRQRDLHDLFGDALDLDVHLQRGDAVGGAGHLEVHVAEVIFVTEDVGQHDEVVAFLDQAHRDAGDRRLDRHARVHQRQRASRRPRPSTRNRSTR